MNDRVMKKLCLASQGKHVFSKGSSALLTIPAYPFLFYYRRKPTIFANGCECFNLEEERKGFNS